ncbi:hypothetical protein D3C75_785480 [compost metagenome]
MHFTYNPSECSIYRIIFYYFLEFIYIFKKGCFFSYPDCPAIPDYINAELSVVVKSLNTYPALYLFLNTPYV